MKKGESGSPDRVPRWQGSEDLGVDKEPVPKDKRVRRNRSIGSQRYRYAMAHNLCVLTGRITREPKVGGKEPERATSWFRLCVPNQDHPRQALFISVRARRQLAMHVLQNLQMGDEVAVIGRLWSARMFRPSKPGGTPFWRQFVYVDAETISGSYPLQIDRDPRFVRVRTDLWNRVCQAVPEIGGLQVPESVRANALQRWRQLLGEYDPDIDETGGSDAGDPDPSSQRTDP